MAETPKALTVVFLTFHIAGGLIGLPIVFLSIVASRQLSRHPTLLNFCATWFFSSLIYTLLFYAGQQGHEHPSLNLCLAQAAMVNGAFPMTSVAGVALVAHIWHGLGPSKPWSQFGLATGRSLKAARLTTLLLTPYIVFLAFTTAGAIVGHANTSRVTSTEALFYCTINSRAFNVFIPTITIVAMALIFLFEVLICFKIYQNTYIRAGINRSGSYLFWLRLAGFTIYAIIALIVAALLLSDRQSFAPYILQASLPLAVFLFIGTQKEVLAIWGSWFRVFSKTQPEPIGHQRSKSTMALLQKKPSTTSFTTPDLMQLRGVPSGDSRSAFDAVLYKSTIPLTGEGHRRPRRPQPAGVTGDESFFNDPARPNQIHIEPQRNDYSNSQQPGHQVKEASRPQELIRPYDVTFPAEPRPHNNFANAPPAHQDSGKQNPEREPDTATIIATQKQTISRLLEEAGYMNRALDRLKSVEQTLHKTQNLLVTERRTASQLLNYTNRMEIDLQNQTNIVNNLLVANKEIEDKFKHQARLQENELNRLTKEVDSLSDALQLSVKNEIQWKEKHDSVQSENNLLIADVKNLKNERDVLLDIWSTLESPIDWEMQKGRKGPPRQSPQYSFPELAQKMKQRASTPAPRPFSKPARQTRRQTDAVHVAKPDATANSLDQKKPGIPVDSLDRLRPRMLELSGKMELSEKVGGLEELVREQTALIEQLEAAVDEKRRGRIRHHVENSLIGGWSIPNSISSSMVAERDGASQDSRSEARL
ncbi:hypothetical protein EW145_g1576 [Phellinidium pouzarii]|uniref:Uncharacterized protein n=1 Tax=Phellinidium pouzarii TaxID=167371 RepID=A0A4S4LDZ0_9AGAM|nr:hypothetical protein EW145_g1576 [Phellinidium pouzarii]